MSLKLGIENIILAVNKMDLVSYDQGVFEAVVADYTEFATIVGICEHAAIPISAFRGDKYRSLYIQQNGLVPRSTLLYTSGEIELDHCSGMPKRLPYACTMGNRASGVLRGHGRIASGTIEPGDEVRILPSGRISMVDRIVTFDET